MKHSIVLAALLIVSCVPNQGYNLAQGIPTKHEVRPFFNIAAQGTVEVSDGGWEGRPFLAVDGDFDTWWSADDYAPQWLEIDFPFPQYVEKIEFVVAQHAPGPATYKIRLENRSGEVVAWHRFDRQRAADGDIYALKIAPQVVRKVRILTTKHQGWVAFRGVRVLSRGIPFDTPSILARPVYLTHAGDDSGRSFVLEQVGRIRIAVDGVLLPIPFLDISHKVTWDIQRGLLGLAFPPNYEQEGQFFVAYANKNGKDTVSRFSEHPNDSNRADPASEEVVLALESGPLHHVGTLAFGPSDGFLYIAVGDGHGTRPGQGSPQFPQDLGSPRGKILRLDVSQGSEPYAIPPTNPFVDIPGYAPEIWALGLRNPWGMHFDPDSGALFIPDTGHVTREEVNYQPPDSRGGQNYGWPCWEGEVATGLCSLDGLVLPVITYTRDKGCAVVGGAVHREKFFFADYCTGKIWALQRQGQNKWQNGLLMTLGVPVSSIGADEYGNLYAVGYLDGKIYPLAIPRDPE